MDASFSKENYDELINQDMYIKLLCVCLVQYYKGAALLWHLENSVGSESDFNEFLRAYIKEFSRKILNTDDFVKFFESYFPKAPKIDWKTWLYEPGMPPVVLNFSTDLEAACRHLTSQVELLRREQIESLNPNQIAYFLSLLLNKKASFDMIDNLHRNCNMSNYSNCEIRFRWFQLCIRVKFEPVLDDIFQFLTIIGRMKFVKPLYVEFKESWPEVMPRLRTFFQEHKQFMNPITAKQLELRINS